MYLNERIINTQAVDINPVKNGDGATMVRGAANPIGDSIFLLSPLQSKKANWVSRVCQRDRQIQAQNNEAKTNKFGMKIELQSEYKHVALSLCLFESREHSEMLRLMSSKG